MGKIITLEEGMNRLEEAPAKVKMILDGYPTKVLFTTEEYIKYYDCVYCMCVQKSPHDHSAHLLQRFKKALEESILWKVLHLYLIKMVHLCCYNFCLCEGYGKVPWRTLFIP